MFASAFRYTNLYPIVFGESLKGALGGQIDDYMGFNQ